MTTVFKIADYLDLKPNVMYMAIQLYDKFMCCRFWEIHKNEFANGRMSEASWDAVCKRISKKTKLYLMSCFQLACKMDSPSNGLGVSLASIAITNYICILTLRLHTNMVFANVRSHLKSLSLFAFLFKHIQQI